MLRLFVDTGMRLAELAGLTVDDVDLDVEQVVFIEGKGRRVRACAIGKRTIMALDRYVRARSRHPAAHLPDLWLGDRTNKAMTSSGIAQIVRRRGDQAGIGGLHPHVFVRCWGASGSAQGPTRASSATSASCSPPPSCTRPQRAGMGPGHLPDWPPTAAT